MNIKKKTQMSLGVVLSYLTIAVKLLSGILYTPIVLHTLGQSQYGVYSLCTSFIGYMTILNAGVNAAYIRFYVQEKMIHEDNVEKLNGLFCKIFIILSIIVFFCGLLIAFFSPTIFGTKITPVEYELVRKCFVLLAFTIAIEIFTCLFKSFITANEEFIFGKSVDILISFLSPVLTLPFLLCGFDCTVIISIRLILAIFALVLDFVFCYKKLNIRFLFKKTEREMYVNISQFIGFIALQSVMDQLNWQVDKFILARTQGTSEISIYSVGSTFNSYFILIGGAVSGIFIAEINKLVAISDEDKLNRLFRRTSKLFIYLIGFIITAFIIFGKSFILCWAGVGYSKSFTVGWMLMLPVTFTLIMGLGQDIARAKNKHQVQIIINVCVCVMNILVSIPLAIYFGAVGSAFGTFITEIIVCIIVQPIYYKKVLELDVKSVFFDILHFFPGIIIPVVFGILIHYLGLLKSTYASIVLFGFIFIALYCVCIVFLSIGKEERRTILAMVKNKIRRLIKPETMR